MPRSVYFGQNVKSEKELYEDLIIESAQVYGFDMQYLPRNIVSQDMLLNEDTETRFDNAFDIEMYIESIDGYEGDGILMSKFGLEIRQQLKIAVSRRRWEQGIGKWNKGYNNYRPSEGDLIYIPGINGLFEIKYVDLESPFHQLNNLPVYKMTLQLFEYRGEDLNTGNAQIDAVQNQMSTPSSYRAMFSYNTGSSAFTLNEYVTLTYPSGATGQAKITDLQVKPTTVSVAAYYGVFLTSSATTISSVNGINFRLYNAGPIDLPDGTISIAACDNQGGQNSFFSNTKNGHIYKQSLALPANSSSTTSSDYLHIVYGGSNPTSPTTLQYDITITSTVWSGPLVLSNYVVNRNLTTYLPFTSSINTIKANYLQLSNLTFTDGSIHPLTNSVTITGATTSASGRLTQVLTLTDGDAVLNDGDISIQNNPIQSRANDIIDFTVVNPFGDTNDT